MWKKNHYHIQNFLFSFQIESTKNRINTLSVHSCIKKNGAMLVAVKATSVLKQDGLRFKRSIALKYPYESCFKQNQRESLKGKEILFLRFRKCLGIMKMFSHTNHKITFNYICIFFN